MDIAKRWGLLIGKAPLHAELDVARSRAGALAGLVEHGVARLDFELDAIVQAVI